MVALTGTATFLLGRYSAPRPADTPILSRTATGMHSAEGTPHPLALPVAAPSPRSFGANESEALGTESVSHSLKKQPVAPWAHFHPLAERNARGRIELIEFNERRLQDSDLSNYMRATYLRRLAMVAIYTIEDFERTSSYPGEPGYEINPTAGQPVSKNGGAIYRIPVGKYAVFDLLDRSSEVRQEICRADIDHLVRRANELLEPYSER